MHLLDEENITHLTFYILHSEEHVHSKLFLRPCTHISRCKMIMLITRVQVSMTKVAPKSPGGLTKTYNSSVITM